MSYDYFDLIVEVNEEEKAREMLEKCAIHLLTKKPVSILQARQSM